MKKITYLILLFIIFTKLTGCQGYVPIFNSEDIKIKISEYSLEGDKILGNKIYTKLHNLFNSNKDNNNLRSVALLIESEKEKNTTSKDSSGKILEYKLTINTHVKIKDLENGNEILNKTFTSSSNFKVQDQYSDTITSENKTLEDLLNKTYQDIIISILGNIN